VAGGAVALLAGPSLADQASPAPPAPPTFFSRWVAGRLSIGADMTYFWLEDTRRASDGGYDNGNPGNFLGSLWGLDAEQHAFPSPFLEYRVVSVVGVGVAYDQARAKTLDWANEEQNLTAGDGDLEIRGLLYYAFARCPNRTRLTPYVHLGLAHYWSRFYVSPGWAAPGRHFDVDDTGGWFVAAGTRVTLWRHLRLDVLYRHSQTEDVTARAYLLRNHHRSGAFPMRSDLLGVGLVYAF
jgi:opacity protein-like surface antigen